MRTCKKCGVEKEEAEFVKRLGKIYWTCKECKHKADKEYYKNNTEEMIKYSNEYYYKNRERISEYNKSEKVTLRREKSRRAKGIRDIHSQEYHDTMKFRPQNHMIGGNNPKWKGGRTINDHGYILIRCLEHPYADYRGYVKEHRLVVEKHIGRYLTREEIVHHINEITDDNRLENLQVMT